jgi:hypothetical protein
LEGVEVDAQVEGRAEPAADGVEGPARGVGVDGPKLSKQGGDVGALAVLEPSPPTALDEGDELDERQLLWRGGRA